MKLHTAAFRAWFNAWLLRVGQVRVVLAITIVSVVLSVLMTWFGNAVFMPEVPWEEWLYISAIVPALITPIVSTLVLSLVYQLAEAKAALVTMSETDPLTGIGNRRHFVKCANAALAEAARTQSPLSIILIDIDQFKRLNDTYGHAVGDDTLVTIASVCREALRTGDVFCRWGGEEFIVLLPGEGLETGCLMAERLRASVAAATVAGVPTGVTISLGVAEVASGSETLDEIIANADRQLYLAKDAGRNSVEPRDPVSAADASLRQVKQQMQTTARKVAS